MLNGKKFGSGKPKLLFGNFANQGAEEEKMQDIQIPDPEVVNELI